MASQEHFDILKQGVEVWNKWRKASPQTKIDLSWLNLNNVELMGIDLSGANLSVTNFEWANLSNADLRTADLQNTTFTQATLCECDLTGAYLQEADLSEAKLNKAKLNEASLIGANLSNADLEDAYLIHAELMGANLMGANLMGAKLQGADLTGANLSHTSLHMANLTECRVHAVSAWGVLLEKTIQADLIITDYDEPTITVDNLEVAQFIYLLLNNPKIREVIDTIAKKAVLILGRFTPERKAVLNALREALRTHGYVPILFDFDKPASRDLTETVSILAHLARFIIVDLTDPSSAPHEVATVIPHTVVPVQPLLWREPLMVDGKVVERREYAMFEDLRRRYHWVLPTHFYTDQAHLVATLKKDVIEPAEQKVQELEKK